MTRTEFSNQFEVLYNNACNQAPGLDEYEKSTFLTKAQNEITKNHYTAQSKGNTLGQGFDDSAKRQADFSCLMSVTNGSPSTIGDFKYICVDSDYNVSEYNSSYFTFTNLSGDVKVIDAGIYTISGEKSIWINNDGIRQLYSVTPELPVSSGTFIKTAEDSGIINKIDNRSTIFTFPANVFIVINEVVIKDDGSILQVIPLKYDDYIRLMSKPYKRPVKSQAWRLINTGNVSAGNVTTKYVELIAGPNDKISTYTIRYIRKPKPIIVGDLDGLTIDGYYLNGGTSVANATATDGECELDPILHEEILQRAVEIAKAAWLATGAENIGATTQMGQRSE